MELPKYIVLKQEGRKLVAIDDMHRYDEAIKNYHQYKDRRKSKKSLKTTQRDDSETNVYVGVKKYETRRKK